MSWDHSAIAVHTARDDRLAVGAADYGVALEPIAIDVDVGPDAVDEREEAACG